LLLFKLTFSNHNRGATKVPGKKGLALFGINLLKLNEEQQTAQYPHKIQQKNRLIIKLSGFK